MDRRLIGQIATPASGNTIAAGRDWCADNGVFAGTYPGDDGYLTWLKDRAHLTGRCAFAVAPDCITRDPDGTLHPDAIGTLTRSAPILPRIRALGFPAALVAQNGLEHLSVPWGDFDVLFIGGDTSWKLGPAARTLTADAHRHGKRVHMGRVNSRARLQYAAAIGCDSADGTYLAYGPDRNLPTLLDWLREIEQQPALFEVTP
jgi:hypothetical protein